MPFWLLMIVLPHWRWTQRIMRSPLVSAAPALLYAALVLPQVGGLLLALARPTLGGVAALLGTPAGATIGWAHFLAFDLFVGRWAYLDSRERAISAWLMAPVLFFVLMLGPIGFLLYLAVRAVDSARQLQQHSFQRV
jgi:ABA DEFICIENT 4-like